jgi:superfamily II DNA/RNA helicase
MQNFRDNKVKILIASDLASRGLDVQDLDFVINMALPEDSATYLHRVGRTARAGKKGIALSLVGFDDSFRLEALEKFLGKPIERFEFYPEELSGPLPRFGDGRTQEARTEHSQSKAPHQKHQSHKHQPKTHTPRPHTPHHRQEVKKAPESKAKTTHLHSAKKQKSFFGKILQSVQNIFGIKSAEAVVTEEKRTHQPQRSHHHRPHSQNAGQRNSGHHKHKGPNRGKPHRQRPK